jgi:predicted nucleic acid-binding protein
VLDASVTLAWLFRDEATAAALAVQDTLRTTTAIVPSIWTWEVANALLVAERRGRVRPAEIEAILPSILALPIEIEGPIDVSDMHRLLPIARAVGLSAYDAGYIELAHRRGLPLATLDERLRRAAEGVGVRVWVA